MSFEVSREESEEDLEFLQSLEIFWELDPDFAKEVAFFRWRFRPTPDKLLSTESVSALESSNPRSANCSSKPTNYPSAYSSSTPQPTLATANFRPASCHPATCYLVPEPVLPAATSRPAGCILIQPISFRPPNCSPICQSDLSAASSGLAGCCPAPEPIRPTASVGSASHHPTPQSDLSALLPASVPGSPHTLAPVPAVISGPASCHSVVKPVLVAASSGSPSPAYPLSG